MIEKKTIAYVGLSPETVEKANRLNLTDKSIVSHYKSTKQEKWKMSTEEWINRLYDKKFKGR